MHFSVNSYCKWIGDKTKFKVEIVGVVNNKCHFLRLENIYVYEALARAYI